MTELNQINNKDFLQELRSRVESEKLKEREVIAILRDYLLKEEEAWERDYERAAQDEQRNKEVREWDKLQAEDSENDW